MSILEIARIQVRRGQELVTGIPQLAPGEFGWAEDTEKLYIGKRISGGAINDNNSEILTVNEIPNIFGTLLAQANTAQTTTYRYRESSPWVGTADTIVRLTQYKLDDNVSLSDFGVIPSSVPVDITLNIQNAVNTIFNNSTWDSEHRADARRLINVPAGNYLISDDVKLPPYTKLVGAGSGLTKLTLASTASNMFSTVDALGKGKAVTLTNTFGIEGMEMGANQARDVTLEGMTLEYDPVLALDTIHALVSLDNVMNVSLNDCVFRVGFDTLTTTTNNVSTWGAGIELNGTGTYSNPVCKNIHVKDSAFDGLAKGLYSSSTVVKPVISRSKFSNLIQGFSFESSLTQSGARGGLFDDNTFENIEQEAFFIGANLNNEITNHISTGNTFKNVGNGLTATDGTTTDAQYSVIKFDSPGNVSKGDIFHRKEAADASIDSLFFYNPLISGRVSYEMGAVTSVPIIMNTTTTVVKLPLTNRDQSIAVNYQLTNSNLSRKGTILLNIAPDGYTTITDNYNFSDSLSVIAEGITMMLSESGINYFTPNSNIDPNSLAKLLAINPADGIWQITGNTTYLDLAASIVAKGPVGDTERFYTSSMNPKFDFSTPGESYSLLEQEATLEFDTAVNTATNYVSLVCVNQSVNFDSVIEFQVSVLA